MKTPEQIRRLHKRHLWMGLVLGLCAAGVGAWQLFRTNGKPKPRPALLVFSGDTAGWLSPCGCTTVQAGGLARRGQYLQFAAQESDVVYADVGGAPAGISAYERLKFETTLRGEIAMGVRAHNIGGPEALLGAEYLREVGRRLNVPFVSANLRDSAGNRVAEALRIVSAGGRRIALVGVLSPRYRTAALRIDEPRAAITSAIASCKGQYDALVVLAYLPEEELVELAGSLPEADIVMGGPTGQNMSMRRMGPVLLASATNMGKFLVEVKMPIGSQSSSWSTDAVEMGPAWPADPQQVSIIGQYMDRLAEADFPADQTGLAPTGAQTRGFAMADPASCAGCHPAAQDVWKRSDHATAWQTLRDKHEEFDPSCQKCHTAGYGLSGGFVSVKRTPALVNVTCQDCHGPSLAHAESQQRRDAHPAPTAFGAQSKYRCTTCHDHENDPEFSYDAKWPKVRHGLVALPATRPTTMASSTNTPRARVLAHATQGTEVSQ